MRQLFKNLVYSVVAVAAAAMLPSCAMENPFEDAGEGKLTLTTSIRGDVTVNTRAAIPAEQLDALREKCVVYIENSKGVIRKYKGLNNVPENIILRTGSYVAEAWTGDSVSASFSSKFYRAYQPFQITEGQNSLALNCNIANVIASVDPSSLDVALSDLKVTFSHSKGALEFNENNIPTEKGYFMMPDADSDLLYKIEGKKLDGTSFSRSGKIQGVERAHEYRMVISDEELPVDDGGALIRIKILDIPVISETVEIFTAPSVTGVDFDIAKQVVSTDHNFQDVKVHIRGYFGLSSVIAHFTGAFTDMPSGINILSGDGIATLGSKGVVVERIQSTDATLDGSDVLVDELFVTFPKSYLDALPPSDREYMIAFDATDDSEEHRMGYGLLRIANTEDAVEHEDPISPSPVPDPENDPMAIAAHSATLSGRINVDGVSNYGIKYREQGTYQWITALPATRSATRASANTTFSVTLQGLKAGTTYEYITFADDFDSSFVQTFTTEGVFVIPNASFEDWSTYGSKNIILPGSTGDKLTSFWGSGNEGSASANLTLTDKSTDMVHSGTYSARMETKAALGVIAAGNLFVGHFVEIYKVSNGKLKLGREYNGSHPDKLRVWANYRPGSGAKVSSSNAGNVEIQNGGTDHGQIYVALTSQPIDICTYSKELKLFNPDDPEVLAYGQVTWKEAFGPEGQLQQVDIPLVYNDRANTARPKFLVITCAASKFGDYFCGAEGSVMYVDDFELVYER